MLQIQSVELEFVCELSATLKNHSSHTVGKIVITQASEATVVPSAVLMAPLIPRVVHQNGANRYLIAKGTVLILVWFVECIRIGKGRRKNERTVERLDIFRRCSIGKRVWMIPLVLGTVGNAFLWQQQRGAGETGNRQFSWDKA